MSEATYAHRFAPCPLYDVEGMEHWLEELAAQGLFLTSGGLFYSYGTFQVGEPKTVRYRLQPLQKKKYYEDDGLPHQSARELAAEYGWEFLCVIEEFAVYTCQDPAARELDTDPQIQAIAMEDLYKRQRSRCIVPLLIWVYWGLRLWSKPMTLLMLVPLWYVLPPLLAWLLKPFACFAELNHLRKLIKKLALGEPLTRPPARKRCLNLHRINTVLTAVLLISLIGMVIFSGVLDWETRSWQPLAEYEGTLPFAAMEDLSPGNLTPRKPMEVITHDYYNPTILYEYPNHVAERSTLMANRQISLQQYGTVTDSGGPTLEGSLKVAYYELRSEWMAEALYSELKRSNPTSRYYKVLDLGELPTEQEYAYSDTTPTLLLQDGTKVLQAQLSQSNGGTVYTLNQWAAIMADAFLNN